MNKRPVKIIIAGDFCPVNRIERLALENNYASIFNDFIDVFQEGDLNIVDLECPLTSSNVPRNKIGPHQKAHPSTVEALKYANINLVAMANNHIMDYGSTGVIDTLQLCSANKIASVGVGRTPEEAAQAFTATIHGKRISILNFADDEFITTPDKAFRCNRLDPVSVFNDIAEIRGSSDYVLAIIHAGNEFYSLPSPRTKKLYRYIIDCGADAIIAHHTHAFSGYEIYKSKLIFYGLGNFIYDWPGKWRTDWNKGYVVKIIISDNVDFELIPLVQNNEIPGVFHLSVEAAHAFRNEQNNMNSIIQDDDKLRYEFDNYCKNVSPMYDSFIEPYFGRYIAALRKRGLFPKFMSGRKRMLLLNIMRCESHREVLLKLLSINE